MSFPVPSPRELRWSFIVVAVPASGAPLPAHPPAQLTLIDAGQSVAKYAHGAIADERALILGEVYRRGGQWKLRAVGQPRRMTIVSRPKPLRVTANPSLR